MTDEAATAAMVRAALGSVGVRSTSTPRYEILSGRRDRPDVTAGDDLAELIASAAPWLRRRRRAGGDQQDRVKAEGRLVDVPRGRPGARGGPRGGAGRRDRPGGGPPRADPDRADPPRLRDGRGRHRRVQCRPRPAGAAAEGPGRVGPRAARRAARPVRARRRGRRLRHDGPAVAQRADRRRARRGRDRRRSATTGARSTRTATSCSSPRWPSIDELCGAAELVKGKCDQVPVAVVRGLGIAAAGRADGAGARCWSGRPRRTCSPSVRPRPARSACTTAATGGRGRDHRRQPRSAGRAIRATPSARLVRMCSGTATVSSWCRRSRPVPRPARWPGPARPIHAAAGSLYADGYATAWLGHRRRRPR